LGEIAEVDEEGDREREALRLWPMLVLMRIMGQCGRIMLVRKRSKGGSGVVCWRSRNAWERKST